MADLIGMPAIHILFRLLTGAQLEVPWAFEVWHATQLLRDISIVVPGSS